MSGEDFSDDYVANLLKQDAKNSNSRYSAFGFGGLKNPTDRAPKANTRFLQNIIRETDSHNAALLAKEQAESRARLRELRSEKDRRGSREEGDPDRHRKRRRVEQPGRSRSRSRNRHDSRIHRPRRDESREREGYTGKRGRGKETDGEDRRRSKHSRRERRHDGESKDDLRKDSERLPRSERHHSHRIRRKKSKSPRREDNGERVHRRRSRIYRSRSLSDAYTSDNNHGKSHRSRRSEHSHGKRSHSRSHSPRELGRRKHVETIASNDIERRKTPSPSPESDPLETLVGPITKPEPKVRRRGRGTYSAAAMDEHFAADYDPSADVKPASDLDDWDEAVEAFRDHQKWKKLGADRLREAGFSEDAIKKWEKGGEKTEEDVQWTKHGEGREWDRGKIVDEFGDVDLKPEWGRLKGT